MSTFSLTQLGLFDNPDERPLPLIVASQWQFRLDHHTHKDTSKYRFLALHWYAGMQGRDPDNRQARQSFRKMYERMRTSNPQWFPEFKDYDTAHVLDKALYIIAQNMRELKDTPQVAAIKRYLASAGAFADAARIDPEGTAEKLLSMASRQRHAELEKYEKHGLADKPEIKRLKLRTDSIDTYNTLMANVKWTIELANETPDYRGIADAENVAMFGMVASGLRVILKTKSIRDALPDMQLSGLQYAETCLIKFLENTDGLTNKQVLMVVDTIIRPIGEHLKKMSAMMGVHPITGQKLLKSNNYLKEDEP